ncbi:hypothetical protein RHS01_02803 [Rhizoctonia solani]|uniref:Uncharacterized protein n=1 Tax=Rhizoctonia solani TaxID=456999 RepID=A0A8H7M8W3_9AGAM|nr:hypothetical protein RHS01_02803 [Rhizoctonia solani]
MNGAPGSIVSTSKLTKTEECLVPRLFENGRSLDELTKEGPPAAQIGNMQPIRDKWIEKVGWMVGRTVPSSMSEEDEEL